MQNAECTRNAEAIAIGKSAGLQAIGIKLCALSPKRKKLNCSRDAADKWNFTTYNGVGEHVYFIV